MSAAGAPPPPPPPPPPQRTSPFDDLPAELLLTIYQYLGLSNYTNLALAIYPTLQRHGLVPDLTIQTVLRITRKTRNLTGLTSLARLPLELFLQIAETLEPEDGIALMFALDARFYRFRDTPTRETVQRLRAWGRRAKRK